MGVTEKRDELIVALNRSGLIGSIRSGYLDNLWAEKGGSTDPDGDKFGIYYYDNALGDQLIPGDTWTTMQNDGKGIRTITNYALDLLPDILDAPSGRYKLNGLSPGDEIYIRHTVNVIPQVAGTTYTFRHIVGSNATGYRLPSAQQSTGYGAGIASGDFVFDTHTFIRGNDAVNNGIMPQIYCSNPSILKLTATYISITRR